MFDQSSTSDVVSAASQNGVPEVKVGVESGWVTCVNELFDGGTYSAARDVVWTCKDPLDSSKGALTRYIKHWHGRGVQWFSSHLSVCSLGILADLDCAETALDPDSFMPDIKDA